jgi:hypothetical protein
MIGMMGAAALDSSTQQLIVYCVALLAVRDYLTKKMLFIHRTERMEKDIQLEEINCREKNVLT